MPPFASGWEVIAFWGSIVVILGVIVECVDLLAKCSKNTWCRKWGRRLVWHSKDRRMIMQFLHHIETYELLIEIIGFILVVAGLGMELYGGTKALLASDEEDRRLQRELAAVDPLTKPIVSLSAIATFRVKGDLFPYGGPPPHPETYRASIVFGQQTNWAGTNVSLSADAPDITVIVVIPRTPSNSDERDVLITFHEMGLYERHFFGVWSWNRQVGFFNSVKDFAMNIPELGSNVNVFPGGTISVTANSSHWIFPIPPQKEKYGVMTGQVVTNANNQIEVKILPVSLSDFMGQHVGEFDGK